MYIVLPGEPDVVEKEDELDFHGLLGARHISIPNTTSSDFADLDLIPMASGDAIVRFIGTVVANGERQWVPAGARVVKQDWGRSIHWSPLYGRAHHAFWAGKVSVTGDITTTVDVTGLEWKQLAEPGAVQILDDELVLQSISLPVGAIVHVADGEFCRPGTMLAQIPDGFPMAAQVEPKPRPSFERLLVSARTCGHPGTTLGLLLKLFGDAPLVASAEFKPSELVPLQAAATSTGSWRWVTHSGQPSVPSEILNDARSRCRFRFLRGLHRLRDHYPKGLKG